MHFGIVTPPVPGHIHPFGALGRELIARGHRVTVLHMAELRDRIRSEDLEFIALGENELAPGALAASLEQLGKLDGFAALKFTIGEVRKTSQMLLDCAPEAAEGAGIEALLVDQTEPVGGTIAERLGIPFVTVSNALMINREPDVPPAFSAWTYRKAAWARLRNRLGYKISQIALSPIISVVREYRKRWGLAVHRSPEESFSPLLQITQQVPAFDFPRACLPKVFHYTGPLRRPYAREIPFPWERLDGRRIVYASLGTLQNGKDRVFRMFAEACLGLDVQLVITHGGGLSEEVAHSFPGEPLVVPYAPQQQVLGRASLTLTHAGLNTALDSLASGVPMVTVPITFEQPAIARRVEWCGAGKTVPFNKLSVDLLRDAILEVLGNFKFRHAAERVRESILRAGGVCRAADLIEAALGLS